jgi:hypothetical protein
MDGLSLDMGPQLRTQGFLCHEIHWLTEQILQVELDTEIAVRRGGAIKRDQDVNVTIWTSGITSGGSE